MGTYVMLLNWTDQGIKNVKESPKRLDGVKKSPRTWAVEVEACSGLLGAHDLVLSLTRRTKEIWLVSPKWIARNVRSTTLELREMKILDQDDGSQACKVSHEGPPATA